MYATLGAGLFGMFALFFGMGALCGPIPLIADGNFITAGVIFVLCSVAAYVCLWVELTHPIYKKQ